MIKKTIAYVCPNRCCDVRVSIHQERALPAEVWLNGELGTFTSFGPGFGLSAEAIRARAWRSECLRRKSRLARSDFRGSEISMQRLAQKFLAVPAVRRDEEKA